MANTATPPIMLWSCSPAEPVEPDSPYNGSYADLLWMVVNTQNKSNAIAYWANGLVEGTANTYQFNAFIVKNGANTPYLYSLKIFSYSNPTPDTFLTDFPTNHQMNSLNTSLSLNKTGVVHADTDDFHDWAIFSGDRTLWNNAQLDENTWLLTAIQTDLNGKNSYLSITSSANAQPASWNNFGPQNRHFVSLSSSAPNSFDIV